MTALMDHETAHWWREKEKGGGRGGGGGEQMSNKSFLTTPNKATQQQQRDESMRQLRGIIRCTIGYLYFSSPHLFRPCCLRLRLVYFLQFGRFFNEKMNRCPVGRLSPNRRPPPDRKRRQKAARTRCSPRVPRRQKKKKEAALSEAPRGGRILVRLLERRP